jgi:hypothetical protein
LKKGDGEEVTSSVTLENMFEWELRIKIKGILKNNVKISSKSFRTSDQCF